jgi:hypothetical protein
MYKLEMVTSKYGLKTSASKIKTIALKGRYPVRSKTVINNNIEEINTFSYLGCSVSYQNGKDITIKISQFMQIKGIINKTLKQNPLKSNNTLDLNILQWYGHVKRMPEDRIPKIIMEWIP